MNRTKRVLAGLAVTTLLWGGVVGTAEARPSQAPLFLGPFPADDGGWGPPQHWCPGQQPVPSTGNHVTDPITWDWNVCHTYYYLWSGMGNVSNMMWDGENPPPRPPPAPALDFCPFPPWCP